jgi:kynureninase
MAAGVNAVLRSILTYSPTDTDRTVLYLSTAYQMVKNTLSYLQSIVPPSPTSGIGLNLLQLNVSFAAYDPNAVVESVRQALESAGPGTVRLACFSHITSIPAVILPLEQLIDVCHQYGVQVMVDGAHALGHIPLNLNALNADYYLSNGHKWMYTPKGNAPQTTFHLSFFNRMVCVVCRHCLFVGQT